ncbi:hypothetical protein B296_00015199 [Ensete ventricosum]|uniref:Uncharacterized protein n=1 Tax=Ensete ventricosum TaxID=4639 RepID=A0A427AHQ5_ENSVE|nr:hypothetical protein B296_00015199 [Ensete ventricosum]
MPINLPGTLFYKAMKARKQLAQIVAKIVLFRRTKLKTEGSGLLGSFMEAKEALTEDQIADNIIGVIFAARDTTASVLTWIVKYLGENPGILKAVTVRNLLCSRCWCWVGSRKRGRQEFDISCDVQEEQEEIMKSKEVGDDEKWVTWADTKRMPFTCRVIQETMRVASVLSFTFREAAEDVEYDGGIRIDFPCHARYLIPKGWKVLPLFRNIHHSPDNFTEPENFDPSRFEVGKRRRKQQPPPISNQSPADKIISLFLSVFNRCRSLQNPTLSCPSGTGPTPALAMSLLSWRCWSSSITSRLNTGNPAETIKTIASV